MKFFVLFIITVTFSFAGTCNGTKDPVQLNKLSNLFLRGEPIICLDHTKDEKLENLLKKRGSGIFVDEEEWAITNDHKYVVSIYSSKRISLTSCCLFK